MRAVFLTYLMLILIFLGCSSDMQWSTVERMIDLEYPDVEQISTDSLAVWLEEPDPPLLIDARSQEEYEVSHLQSAIRVDPDDPDLSALDEVPRDTPLVTYCSVGYRSSGIAATLMDEGFTNVSNLQGSIFHWANDGRPVYRDGLPVRQVHPYDRLWGQLLNEELRSTRPRPAGL